MLIDGGSALRGTRRALVLPFLRDQGIRRIDVLALTHPHEDHYGGAAAVLARCLSARSGSRKGSTGGVRAGRRLVDRAGANRPGGVRERIGGVEIVVRAPTNPVEGGKANERGMVLEVRFGILSVWLPGMWRGGLPSGGSLRWTRRNGRSCFCPTTDPGADPAGWAAFCRPHVVVAQNSRCFTGGNLIPSPERFALENGAFTVRSDGRGISFAQSAHSGVWKCLWRLM